MQRMLHLICKLLITKLRSILSNEAPADSVAVDSTATPVVAQATSTADSLAAALKGENKAQSVDLAQIKERTPVTGCSTN